MQSFIARTKPENGRGKKKKKELVTYNLYMLSQDFSEASQVGT